MLSRVNKNMTLREIFRILGPASGESEFRSEGRCWEWYFVPDKLLAIPIDSDPEARPKSFDIWNIDGDASLGYENGSAGALFFEISAAGVAEMHEAYKAGDPIPVRCVFKNHISTPVTILLRDHDPYLGTLPYPDEIQARVSDSSGQILTTNDVSNNEWWNSFYSSSQLMLERPGDRVTISPGEQVTRVIPLERVLGGCPGLHDGLPAGRYTVQLKLARLVSNPLVIEVAQK
jgi:hypothetical protein